MILNLLKVPMLIDSYLIFFVLHNLFVTQREIYTEQLDRKSYGLNYTFSIGIRFKENARQLFCLILLKLICVSGF